MGGVVRRGAKGGGHAILRVDAGDEGRHRVDAEPGQRAPAEGEGEQDRGGRRAGGEQSHALPLSVLPPGPARQGGPAQGEDADGGCELRRVAAEGRHGRGEIAVLGATALAEKWPGDGAGKGDAL